MSKTEIYLERQEIVEALDFNEVEYKVFTDVLRIKFEAFNYGNITKDRERQHKDAILENYLLGMLESEDFLKALDSKIDSRERNILLWNVKRLKSNREIVEDFQSKMAKENEILTYRTCLDWLSVIN